MRTSKLTFQDFIYLKMNTLEKKFKPLVKERILSGKLKHRMELTD